jgi:two-component system NtrC family sensor kinase
MKTIRGKVISFFVLCLAFAGILASLYYLNAFSLRRKIYTIERFDDLLNDVLELRRYEKNILFYKDPPSLQEGRVYLEKVEDDYSHLKEDIASIVGPTESAAFASNLARYGAILDTIIISEQAHGPPEQEDKLRAEGKRLVDFAQLLIQRKRHRIDQTLKRVLVIPLASIGFLIVLVLVIFLFVTTGILKPLSLVENATEKVAKDSFTPISYDKNKQDEITHLIASFNKMVAELDSRQEQLVQSRKLASIGTLTSGIAHELNNPLNNISITAESLMLNYPNMTSEEIGEMIDDILGQTERASLVVKNLLEFSRTERPGLRNLEISNVLERTLNLIKNQMVVAQIRIEKEIASDLPVVQGKRQDLQQAFVNILLNAIQAMPDGGLITIRAGLGPPGYLQIDISDTGIGIKPEALEHIFDPFYTTKQSEQGTGLGLSIVYNIIRTHGGYIQVKSKVDKGTTFSIFLPINTQKKVSQNDIQSSSCR